MRYRKPNLDWGEKTPIHRLIRLAGDGRMPMSNYPRLSEEIFARLWAEIRLVKKNLPKKKNRQ